MTINIYRLWKSSARVTISAFVSLLSFSTASCTHKSSKTDDTLRAINNIQQSVTKKEIPKPLSKDIGQFGDDYWIVENFYNEGKQTILLNNEITTLQMNQGKWFTAVAITDKNENLKNQDKAIRLSQLFLDYSKLLAKMYKEIDINRFTKDVEVNRETIEEVQISKSQLLPTVVMMNLYCDYYIKTKLLLEFALKKSILKKDKIDFANSEDRAKYQLLAKELQRIASRADNIRMR
jgi:hypothetical protein